MHSEIPRLTRSHMNYAARNDAEDIITIYTGQECFFIPLDVTQVRVKHSVRAIKEWAFHDCMRLTHVHLADCKGLEKIKNKAFCGCTSLRKIVIPPAIRRIKDQAFDGCMIVTNTIDATI
jgi:hypothetical protein